MGEGTTWLEKRLADRTTELVEENERLRKYLTAARPVIEAHKPRLHAEIMADPMWQPVPSTPSGA